MSRLSSRQQVLIAAATARSDRTAAEAQQVIDQQVGPLRGQVVGRVGDQYQIRLQSGGIVRATALTNAAVSGQVTVERARGSVQPTFRALPR